MSDNIPHVAIVPVKKPRIDSTMWTACILCRCSNTPMLQVTQPGTEKVKSAHES